MQSLRPVKAVVMDKPEKIRMDSFPLPLAEAEEAVQMLGTEGVLKVVIEP